MSNKVKVPGGAFYAGDGLTVDPMTRTVSAGGGGSVPKPLTYDYMPEGYPTKSVQTTTLMEEQEVAFVSSEENGYKALITNAFEVVEGQTYTVNWDGTEYECVGIVAQSNYTLGNLSIVGAGSDTGEPFVYAYNTKHAQGMFVTLDTAASHTISVKTTAEVITPMAEEFLPNILEINSIIMNSSTTDSTKKFRITVDDSGTLSATGVTA